jgi:MtN3 and saliva related transmembrane protein
MDQAVEVIGYAAAVLTTAAFAPQVWRTWRTRSARDLSLAMLLAQGTGNFLWFVYAALAGVAPLAGANALTFMLIAALLVMKLGDRRPAPIPAPIPATVAAE